MIQRWLIGVQAFLKLQWFRRRWRQANPHNETMPGTVFPMELVQVGKYSYGPLNVHHWGTPGEKLIIGSFVSIAAGVRFILGGNHPTDHLLNFPVRVKMLGWREECYSKGPIEVGDDVWFGQEAMILSGSRIGKGAVIGARAVIAGEVPPFAIVVGNPARVVRKRFPDDIIRQLLELDYNSFPPSFFAAHEKDLYEPLDQARLDRLRTALAPGTVRGQAT